MSILTTFSKIFEKVLANQISPFLDTVFSPQLSAFRNGYSCQDALLSLTETWRDELRCGNKVGALLMDLSKAFDCMSHRLLLAKLAAYGTSPQAVSIIKSYLTNRQQRVKIGQHLSSWQTVQKGVPQGSILGPILFNIFLNDLFYFIKRALLTNYADDNTISAANKLLEEIVRILTSETEIAIKWFQINLMSANPDKFQAIFLGTQGPLMPLNVADICIIPETHVKLLGVNIDNKLNFTPHVQELCKKAGRQLNVLMRLSSYLSTKTKLAIYRCFVLSHFRYCAAVWHHCGATSSAKLERIQVRALRFTFNDFDASSESLLSRAGLPTLEMGRLNEIATQTFKIINHLSPTYLSELVTIKPQIRDLRSGKLILKIPIFRSTKFGLHSFRYTAAKTWNKLPEELRLKTSLSVFKKGLMDLSWSGAY